MSFETLAIPVLSLSLSLLLALGGCSGDDKPNGGGGALEAAAAMCAGKTTESSPPFNAQDFCSLYIVQCGSVGMVPALKMQTSCVAAFAGWTATQRSCRSFHLCNTLPSMDTQITHCPHAEGVDVCM